MLTKTAEVFSSESGAYALVSQKIGLSEPRYKSGGDRMPTDNKKLY